MKKLFLLLFGFLVITTVKSFAQITITAGEVQNYIAVGNKLTVTDDTSDTSLNIGTTGANTWDFSSLSTDSGTSVNAVAPSSTPFGNNYPSATTGILNTEVISGSQVEGWQYFGVNNALLDYGYSGQGNVSGFQISFISKNVPPSKNLVLPLTMGTSWTEDYVKRDSTIITALPTNVSVTKIHDENVVDAYGNMTLPGGITVPALRIKTDTKTYEQTGSSVYYTRTISYIFLSTGGTQLTVDAADTTSPNTGVIKVSSISFIISGITGVKQADNTIPGNFNLEQNYPNPFNPATEIKYSIPASSGGLVTLKIYDMLGREVATLVNGEKPAGTYGVTWNAVNMPSGVYFYQLKAGSFSATKKLMLLK